MKCFNQMKTVEEEFHSKKKKNPSCPQFNREYREFTHEYCSNSLCASFLCENKCEMAATSCLWGLLGNQ